MWLQRNSLSIVVALSIASLGLAKADTLSGSSGVWQDWNSANLAVDSTSVSIGTPYWNNASGDGPSMNVGFCLTGTGGCTMAAGAQGALPYFGTVSGSGSPSLMYITSSGSSINLSLQTMLTTQTSVANGFDVFGYYTGTQGGSSVTLNPLFDTRTSTVGQVATISGLAAGDTYGFYIENIKGYGGPFATDYIYFMNSSANSADGSMPADGYQHFAAFEDTSSDYFIGDVDGDACQNGFTTTDSPCVPSSAFDYNDLMVEIGPGVVTPEPASIALLGGGLILLGAAIRRRRNQVSEK